MKLALGTDRDIVVTREFAAPRARVFAAHTEPDLLKRWFGPHDWRLTVCEIDLRIGGAWRYVMHGPADQEMVLAGRYLEIESPARLVTVESNVDCDARAEHESIVTLELTEHDGRTTLTNTIHFPNREIRDAVLASGMERGVGQGYDRLAETLADTLETP